MKRFSLLLALALLVGCEPNSVELPGTVWWYCGCGWHEGKSQIGYVCSSDGRENFLQAQDVASRCMGYECACTLHGAG